MKDLHYILFILVIGVFGNGCDNNPNEADKSENETAYLTYEEEELADSLNFSRSVIGELKYETWGDFYAFSRPGYLYSNYTGGMVKQPGFTSAIYAEVSAGSAIDAIESLQESFRDRGYQLFKGESDYDYEYEDLIVLKSWYPLEVIKLVGTDPLDEEVDNDSVLRRLKIWDKESDFRIMGAGSNWLELKFVELPEDKSGFFDEIIEFCPNYSLEFSPEEKDSFIDTISEDFWLYLWWT